MRPLPLRTLLAGLNAALVLLAVAAVAVAASRRLARLADEQARARVELAAVAAREVLAGEAARVATSARLLAERPTLERLLRQGDVPGLEAFLDRFRATSGLAGCAILAGGRGQAGPDASAAAGGLLAAGGAPLPWRELAAAVERSEGAAAVAPGGTGPLLAAAAPLPAVPGALALAALELDAALAARASEQVGLPVALIGPSELRAAGGERFRLREEALLAGRPAVGHVAAGDEYVAVLPFAGAGGQEGVLVEAALAAGTAAEPVERLRRSLVPLSLGAAALAVVVGLAVSRRVARPLQRLAEAARRIGAGDLATPIAAAPGVEAGSLAGSMEEMRHRLLRLTAELEARKAEAEAILGGIREGVFAVDRDRRLLYLNAPAAAMLGVPAGEALGRFCGDVLNAREADGSRPCEDRCPILHARFRGGAHATEHLVLASGERRAVVITSSPAADARQFQVMRDETDLEAARRLRDAVLANVTHEFRTPLAAQLASIELLRDRLAEAGGEEPLALVAALERGTLRLTRLIDNLLESVRIEAGRTDIRRRPVALDEVIEEAAEQAAPLLAQRGQRLAIELPHPLPELLGDGPRLAQVFVNLLANANKYAPQGSTIAIGGAVEPGGVRLWVDDEGPGLPAGGSGSLFEPFFRGAAGEPEAGGMGLGLAIVRSIVERHGGSVEAQPRERGTRLSIRLPVAGPA